MSKCYLFPTKRPEEVRNARVDWTDQLAVTGEKIVNVDVYSTQGSIQITNLDFNTKVVFFTISEGEVGESCRIICKITTDSNPTQILDEEISLLIVS